MPYAQLITLLFPNHIRLYFESDQKITQRQDKTTSASGGLTNTFELDGRIGSLILGMPPNTKTIDMTTVPKFILSGDWNLNVDQGKLADFAATSYTGPVNGAENYTHQLSNFRVSGDNPFD